MQLNMGEGKSSVIVPVIAATLADRSKLVRVMMSHVLHLLRQGGILLLMIIECNLGGDMRLAGPMIQALDYLDTHVRDIVDESDALQPVDFHGDRWTLIQDLLGRLWTLCEQEHQSGPRGHVMPTLMDMLADSICNIGLDGLLKRYLLEAEYDKDSADVREVEDNFATGSPVHQDLRKLWILRGLIGGGILRWRVNYGRSQTVPYVAKDCPSPRSEFSHPDVVIVLTCLTYYYEGLTNKELHAALGCLEKHNQVEFATWVCHSKEAQNELCETKPFPKIRHRKPVIDFYLSRVVFPRYLKEFPQKLSASGWDLARSTDHPLTGFMTHLELEEQCHTNSHVLSCLLRPENRVQKIEPRQGESFSSLLIRSVVASSDPLQVILDVGAQILELDNRQAASTWLKATTDSKFEAAIYFDDQEELSVVSRAGKTEKLMASSYLGQPQKCLVFLDEAHTRGTDLVLPHYYCAAVTLGPRLSKDRLVQGE
ncbi:hypothetical protein F5X68DRAFT_246307 [Plectosphaerella plurivora]|uniref:ubiquitinyl hydrolase 1 n=1 Tax=Plectosphaerella plurivora TaxID=936078 RepID=A0A9P9A5G5_9PEZI|nr:hypothetical protein F5X68DRAFT_246307 [Plectosphaerella plurivora]